MDRALSNHRSVLSGRLESTFQRGVKLSVSDRNYDYAHELIAQCVVQLPSSDTYADAMLLNLCEKHRSRPKVLLPFLTRRRNRTLVDSLKQELWPVVFQKGTHLLKSNPWDVQTLRCLAMACEACHYNEAELVYLKQALDAAPKCVEVNRHCARTLARVGQFDQAIACWHRVEVLCGKDAEAAMMISRLAEQKLKHPNGMPTVASSRPATSTPSNTKDATATQVTTLPPRQLLERALIDKPSDESLHHQLVQLLIDSGDDEGALSAIERAMAACGDVPGLQEQQAIAARHLNKPPSSTSNEARAEQGDDCRDFRVPWLELMLVLPIVGLTIQLVPGASVFLGRVSDMRKWPREVWLGVNIIVMLFLVSLRFAPEIRETWQKWRSTRRRRLPKMR